MLPTNTQLVRELIAHSEKVNKISKALLDEWMDQGPSAPTNRDLVRHDKIDVELLQHLVRFVVDNTLRNHVS